MGSKVNYLLLLGLFSSWAMAQSIQNEFIGTSQVGLRKNVALFEAPEEYKVEPGDTLYDVCDQLIDEADYWPKLWAINPYIKNPHFIWPGMRLSFYPGDDENPPSLAVSAADSIVPIDRKGEAFQNFLLESLRPSFNRVIFDPTLVLDADDIEAKDGIFEVFGAYEIPNEIKLNVPGFIVPTEMKPVAIVQGGSLGQHIIPEGKSFIAKNKGDMAIGEVYSVVRFIKDINDQRSGDYIGKLYLAISTVKVKGIIDNGLFVEAEVVQSFGDTHFDDLVVPFRSTRRKISQDLTVDELELSDARIAAFEIEGKKLGGEGSMVFVDRGADDGIELGQKYKISQNLDFLVSIGILTTTIKDKLDVGYLEIIDVTQKASLGYVFKARWELLIGDYVGLSDEIVQF